MKIQTAMALALTLAAGAAIAEDASSCYNISDADKRAACLAKAHSDSGRCYAIKDQSARAECQAQTRN